MDKSEKLKIYARCLSDPIYTIETFLKTYDLTQKGLYLLNYFINRKK